MSKRPSSGGRCPICGAPVDPALRPFCSKRCADIDLARWMSETYVVPGGDSDADEDGDKAEATRGEREGREPPDRLH
ncbi:MAG: DNA gyrase inhibitor YacG [Hyphomicrobiaceae bacterium]